MSDLPGMWDESDFLGGWSDTEDDYQTGSRRKGDWCISSTGNQFWPLDMRPSDVYIADIANSLSKLCRFGGHCKEFYSVAQHSVIVSLLVPKEYRLIALLHDATEAYCGDIIRPLKINLPGFDLIEQSIWQAIACRFNLPLEIPEEVSVEDARVLLIEKRDLTVPHSYPWDFPQCKYPNLELPEGLMINPLLPRQAKSLFMDHFSKYGGLSF